MRRVLLRQRAPVIFRFEPLHHVFHLNAVVEAFAIDTQQADKRVARHDIEVNIGQRAPGP